MTDGPPRGQLSPDAPVVRGGASNDADAFLAAAETVDSQGRLFGVSVDSADSAPLEQLARYLPHGKIGVTTIGGIRALGGTVVPTPTWNNPFHCDLGGITADQARRLFGQTCNNPVSRSARMPLGR